MPTCQARAKASCAMTLAAPNRGLTPAIREVFEGRGCNELRRSPRRQRLRHAGRQRASSRWARRVATPRSARACTAISATTAPAGLRAASRRRPPAAPAARRRLHVRLALQLQHVRHARRGRRQLRLHPSLQEDPPLPRRNVQRAGRGRDRLHGLDVRHPRRPLLRDQRRQRLHQDRPLQRGRALRSRQQRPHAYAAGGSCFLLGLATSSHLHGPRRRRRRVRRAERPHLCRPGGVQLRQQGVHHRPGALPVAPGARFTPTRRICRLFVAVKGIAY